MKILLLILLCPLIVFAKEETNLACDKTTINIGEQVVCRLSINSNKEYNTVNYNIKELDGISLIDVRSNYSNLWKVNKEGATSTSIVNGLQEFGILLFKASKSGVYDIEINNVSYGIYNKEMTDIDVKKCSIKVISDDNYLNNIKINDKEISNFDKNTLFYDIDTDLEEIEIEVSQSNKFSKVSGTGKYKINNEYEVILLPVLSESGSLKTYVLNIHNLNYKENNTSIKLEDIGIKDDKGNSIIVNYKEDIYRYDIELKNDNQSISITPKVSENGTLVKGYNGGKFDIISGNNVILIKVKDKNNNTLTYTLNIIKPIEKLSNNSYIKDIIIEGYDLSFSKKVKNYNLEINKGSKTLNIKTTLDDENSSIEIIGNKDLKNGSIIKLVVTAPNGTKSTYKINITIKKFNMLTLLYLLIPIFIIYIGIKYKDNIKTFINNLRSIDKLSYNKLLERYNNIYGEKGLTKFFEKLKEEDRRLILIEAINNNIQANKTSIYLNIYRSSKSNVKKKKKTKKRKS